MFQVMVFSMLHYSISQSNNSTFSHQRTLSRLIVYHHPPPAVAAAATSPFAACLRALWCVVTMETGPSWMVLLLWLRSQRSSGTAPSQKCRRMKGGGYFGSRGKDRHKISGDGGFLVSRSPVKEPKAELRGEEHGP